MMMPISRRDLIVAGLSSLAAFPSKATAAEVLTFDTLYESFGVLGLKFSTQVLALKDRPIVISGYMAPPLRAESDFFVLTKNPLSICPFCQSDADWPLDILVVYLAEASPLVTAGAKVTVTGMLEIGSYIDPDSGFVSQLRVRDASYRKA
jgi:hypothetical protein